MFDVLPLAADLTTPCCCIKGQEVVRITYEDLSADGSVGDAVIRRVLDFLKVDSHFIPSRLDVTEKQTIKPLSQAIENYAELRSAFKLHPKCNQISWE